jgi:5-methylcytosine-specific restriction endonuclease McrA
MPSLITKFLNPWRYQRELREERTAALRERDGDNCARCRRPIRFDRPAGHDQGAKIEPIQSQDARGPETLDNLCLTHGRCNTKAGDDTAAVMERLRPKREAELLPKARKRRSQGKARAASR